MRPVAHIHHLQVSERCNPNNVSLVNLWFCAAFFGPALICCVLAVLKQQALKLVLLGCARYFVGTMLVTFAFNVPLNYTLATLDRPALNASSGLAVHYLDELEPCTNRRRAVGCGIVHYGIPFSSVRSFPFPTLTLISGYFVTARELALEWVRTIQRRSHYWYRNLSDPD